MNLKRREVLKAGGGLGAFGVLAAAGLITPEVALAKRNEVAFGAKKLDDALKALGAKNVSDSGDVTLTAPDIAENGAVVPMRASSKLADTESIVLLIEKNPLPLAAAFHLSKGASASVLTRCKMGKTSNVHALVKAGGKFYTTKKEIKVTRGGCGG